MPDPEAIPKLEQKCPACFASVPFDAAFCPHCGTSLKDRGPSTTIGRQIVAYLISALLPPLGYWYGWKYLKRPDALSKKIGWAALIITTVSLILTSWWTVSLLNSVNQQMNSLTNGSLL